MPDFLGDRECITHHHACDCREAEARSVAAERDRLREALREEEMRSALLRAHLDRCQENSRDDDRLFSENVRLHEALSFVAREDFDWVDDTDEAQRLARAALASTSPGQEGPET